MKITVAHSPDSDDAFMFYGIASGAVPTNGLQIEQVLADIETLNRGATASERMKKIPAFVRGMVIRAVEDSCRRNGISRVTAEELERIRARMPTPKIFG